MGELYPGVYFDVLIPPDTKMGDYSTNIAFILAKKDGKKPVDVANEIKEKLESKEMNSVCTVEVASNGFLNFYLKHEFLQKQLAEISKDESYGSSKEGKGKKVIVEYSSPNIAKPMHIGHLRSTIIGDALANVYERLGYEVIRWNYIGDWGTQFGKLIAAWKRNEWGSKKDVPTLEEMVKLYVEQSQIELASPEGQEKAGQEEFARLESGDKENRKIWDEVRKISLEEVGKTYKRIMVSKFDVIKGESDYEVKLKPLIEELKKKGITKKSEGALIVELDKLPPAMIQKSDGATLYITRDLASLEDRIKNYKPERILYVVANQQALHFEQLIAVATKLGWLRENVMRHVKFGMVLGEDGKKLATREGKVIPLQEVIDKVTDLARKTVKDKNPDLSSEEAEKVAHVVAIGALKYNDLRQHPYSDITFDWKAMLDLSGNSGPYLQYTYARLANIINKAGKFGKGDLSTLTESSVRQLMRQLLDFPEAVYDCTKFYTLNGLALYLYDLAHLANKFYEEIYILKDENKPRRDARLMLVRATAGILKSGLGLLGVKTLEKI